MFKKFFVILFILILAGGVFALQSEAAKKSSKGGISEEDLTSMSDSIDSLTEKMYAKGLFSPEDSKNLITIKIKLDNQMLVAPDPTLAPLYYKLGMLFKSRDMKDEATDCFQTILENFADTALAPKATAQLKLMGVSISLPMKGAAPDATVAG